MRLAAWGGQTLHAWLRQVIAIDPNQAGCFVRFSSQGVFSAKVVGVSSAMTIPGAAVSIRLRSVAKMPGKSSLISPQLLMSAHSILRRYTRAEHAKGSAGSRQEQTEARALLPGGLFPLLLQRPGRRARA